MTNTGFLASLRKGAFSGRKSGRIPDYFSEAALDEITRAVHEAEKNTSGEIRVKIRVRFDEGVADIHAQAMRDFEEDGLHNTKDKTGVLILVVLEARTFKILADSGIYSKLPQSYWDNRAKHLADFFGGGNYSGGMCAVVGEVGRVLSEHFPRKAGDENELPDDVIEEGGR